jgi:hypothetical protein
MSTDSIRGWYHSLSPTLHKVTFDSSVLVNTFKANFLITRLKVLCRFFSYRQECMQTHIRSVGLITILKPPVMKRKIFTHAANCPPIFRLSSPCPNHYSARVRPGFETRGDFFEIWFEARLLKQLAERLPPCPSTWSIVEVI